MARLVGAFAASHAPLIARDWDKIPEASQTRLTGALRELGSRLSAARPDVLVMVSPDHWINFFLDNLPSVCIGVGAEHVGPPEPFLQDFPHKTMAGHPALGLHIVGTALEKGFEPSVSHRLTLDHGFCIPLSRMELETLPAIVPMIVNDLEPPLPTVPRCFQWGRLLADAIASYPEDLRVAILATGGLSHSIGEPTMGAIDEPFDRDCIRAFEHGDEAGIVSLLDARMAAAGNGSHEIRNWAVVHGAAGDRGFELVDYLAVPEVYVGCGFASWNLADA